MRETYWTYFPDPSIVQPATWNGGSIPIFTNHSAMIGGRNDSHIQPVSYGNNTYEGFSKDVPICLSAKDKTLRCPRKIRPPMVALR